jgi:hypothetical protein
VNHAHERGRDLWFLQTKAKLTFNIRRDSHKHNHVNTQNGKSHVQIEWPSYSVHHNEVANEWKIACANWVAFLHHSSQWSYGWMENYMYQLNGIFVAFITMKLWISLMEVLRSWKLFVEIEFDMGNFTSIYTYWTFRSRKFLNKFPTYMWSMFIHMCPCALMCELWMNQNSINIEWKVD